jgi:hypothetical protein
MRLSMDERDRAYNPYEAVRATVRLDGVELKDCITADEETGECVCFVTSYPGPSDRPPTVVRSGKVEIELNSK